MRINGLFEKEGEDLSIENSSRDNSNALFVMSGCWVIAGLFSKFILPCIAGIPIHQYVYLVIISIMLNISGVTPPRLRKGIGVVYKFANTALTPSAFAGMAISLLDFQSFINALSVQTLSMCIVIIIGAIITLSLSGFYIFKLITKMKRFPK